MGIKDSIEKAEILKQEAEKMLARNKELLAKADEEARKLIAEGKGMAEKLRNELMSKHMMMQQECFITLKQKLKRKSPALMN
jgi:F-type H+-transporting ATPase subunit b